MNQPLKVRILDRDYPLLVQAGDVETMQDVARRVDQRMRAFKEQHPDQPDLVAAVITALFLAEELDGVRETFGVLVATLDREADHLDRQLSEVLAEVDPISIEE